MWWAGLVWQILCFEAMTLVLLGLACGLASPPASSGMACFMAPHFLVNDEYYLYTKEKEYADSFIYY